MYTQLLLLIFIYIICQPNIESFTGVDNNIANRILNNSEYKESKVKQHVVNKNCRKIYDDDFRTSTNITPQIFS